MYTKCKYNGLSKISNCYLNGIHRETTGMCYEQSNKLY